MAAKEFGVLKQLKQKQARCEHGLEANYKESLKQAIDTLLATTNQSGCHFNKKFTKPI
jgi:hypothetical protein